MCHFLQVFSVIVMLVAKLFPALAVAKARYICSDEAAVVQTSETSANRKFKLQLLLVLYLYLRVSYRFKLYSLSPVEHPFQLCLMPSE